MPASPASPPLTAQVISTIRSVSMPVVSASWMLSASARACLPSEVERSASATSTIVAIPSSVTMSSVRPILSSPNAHRLRHVGSGLPVLGAGHEGDAVAHEEREPEREQEQLQLPGSATANGSPDADLEPDAEDRGRDDAKSGGGDEREVERAEKQHQVRPEGQNSPCAKLTSRRTPKMSVRPTAPRA